MESQLQGGTCCECILAQNCLLQPIFDHDGIVANAGLIEPATLMAAWVWALIDRG